MEINILNEFIKDELEDRYVDALTSELNSFIDNPENNVNISGKSSKVNEVLWASVDTINSVSEISAEMNTKDVFKATAITSATIEVNDTFARETISDSHELQYEIEVYGEIDNGSDGSQGINIINIVIVGQVLDGSNSSDRYLGRPEDIF